MQVFPCPFCGPRNEREFHFAGEAGKSRPETTGLITETDWAGYLHTQRNDKGPVREIWMHLPCQEVFLMERDSVSMTILGTTTLRKEQT